MAFLNFYNSKYQNKLCSNGSESLKELFERLSEDEKECLQFNIDSKSDLNSTVLRESGNKMFKGKTKFEDLMAVSKIYTKALFNAKSNIEKAYSYGNRSSVLFKIGIYKSCLTDVNLAIKHEYPKSKQYRLFIRKAESFLMLKDFEKASLSFADALLNLSEEDPSAFLFKKRIEHGLKLCQLRDYDKELEFPITMSLNYPTVSNTLNASEQVLSMSNELYLEVNKNDGRGIFASSNIAIGDILVIEDPYARRLAKDCFFTHCYFCLKHNFNLIPCDGCCMVGFCNDECQANANSQLRHDLECGMLTEILSTKSGELGLLAYGTICQTSIGTIRHALNRIENHENNLANEIIDSQSYLSAITIETNEHLRTFEDLLDRCISSVFLAHCFVKMMNNYEKPEVVNDLHIMIVQAFCKHLQGLPCNAHSLSETIVPIGGSLELSSVNYIGNALYPALSMINHSCSPNVVRITMGSGQCVLKAICPIKSGEQIFDNYSFHFATSSLKMRTTCLKEQYYFDCRCNACIENWPTFESQLRSSDEPRLICPSCQMQIKSSTLICSACDCSIHDKYKHFVELKSCLSDNMEHLLKRQYGDVEKYLLEFCTLLHEIIKPPHILFNQTSEMLKLIWSMNGSHMSYF